MFGDMQDVLDFQVLCMCWPELGAMLGSGVMLGVFERDVLRGYCLCFSVWFELTCKGDLNFRVFWVCIVVVGGTFPDW